MLKFLDHLQDKIDTNVKTTDDCIPVSATFAKRLSDEMTEGDHVYLQLSYLNRYEIVKYTHNDANIKAGKCIEKCIVVERDAANTGRKNFPCASDIKGNWNSLQMREFIELVNGD